MTLLATANGCDVHVCDWRALPVDTCDALFTDTPYSERTHVGHDAGNAQQFDAADRRAMPYRPWTGKDVVAFVDHWHPRTRGWMVSITDHYLAIDWQHAFEAVGRYAFAPLPFVATGSRVRLQGDGPSMWSTSIVVARPRTKAMATWGTLPGAYILPPGHGGAMPVVGGKPPWLMQRLVEDYSRTGDLVVDPCCGAGTTAIGAIRSGRRAIVGDCNEAHAQLAAQWVAHPYRPAPSIERADTGPQVSLFGAA